MKRKIPLTIEDHHSIGAVLFTVDQQTRYLLNHSGYRGAHRVSVRLRKATGKLLAARYQLDELYWQCLYDRGLLLRDPSVYYPGPDASPYFPGGDCPPEVAPVTLDTLESMGHAIWEVAQRLWRASGQLPHGQVSGETCNLLRWAWSTVVLDRDVDQPLLPCVP